MENTSPQAEPQQRPMSIEERISAATAPEEQAPEERSERPQAAPEPADEVSEVSDEAEPEQAVDGGEDTDEDAVSITSLADLRDILDVDEADLYNLSITASLNGKPQNVTLSELKDAFVGAKEAARMREEAKAAREAAREEGKKAQDEYKQQLAQGAAMVDALERSALQKFDGVNWNELRASDPAEWSAKVNEWNNARAEIEQVKTHVKQQIEQYNAQIKQRQSAEAELRLAKEYEALQAAWPELHDEKTGERDALVKELKSRGFSEQEISAADDHRIFLLARDAMRYRQQAEKTDAAKKKVIKVGKKVITPGARLDKAQRQSEALRPLRQQLKKSGNMNDAAALLSRMKRG